MWRLNAALKCSPSGLATRSATSATATLPPPSRPLAPIHWGVRDGPAWPRECKGGRLLPGCGSVLVSVVPGCGPVLPG